jgi:YwiC-like protein
VRPALRPLALPNEHGGWGFLLEPLALGLLVAPSISGVLVAIAALFGFLTRQPLKYALQDALRGKRYPRTRYCWMIALAYAIAAAAALIVAVAAGRLILVIPFGLVAPLAVTVVLYDANNRGRSALPEFAGAAAMSSSAAAVAIAGGMRIVPALALSGIIVARSLPSIAYVRTLLKRAHGGTPASWPALVAHAVAAFAVATFAPLLAVVAMVVLLVRAAWGLAHPPARARTIGWSEIAFGTVTVGLIATGYLIR